MGVARLVPQESAPPSIRRMPCRSADAQMQMDLFGVRGTLTRPITSCSRT